MSGALGIESLLKPVGPGAPAPTPRRGAPKYLRRFSNVAQHVGGGARKVRHSARRLQAEMEAVRDGIIAVDPGPMAELADVLDEVIATLDAVVTRLEQARAMELASGVWAPDLL